MDTLTNNRKIKTAVNILEALKLTGLIGKINNELFKKAFKEAKEYYDNFSKNKIEYCNLAGLIVIEYLKRVGKAYIFNPETEIKENRDYKKLIKKLVKLTGGDLRNLKFIIKPIKNNILDAHVVFKYKTKSYKGDIDYCSEWGNLTYMTNLLYYLNEFIKNINRPKVPEKLFYAKLWGAHGFVGFDFYRNEHIYEVLFLTTEQRRILATVETEYHPLFNFVMNIIALPIDIFLFVHDAYNAIKSFLKNLRS